MYNYKHFYLPAYLASIARWLTGGLQLSLTVYSAIYLTGASICDATTEGKLLQVAPKNTYDTKALSYYETISHSILEKFTHV